LKRAVPVGDLSAWKARGKISSFQDPNTSALDFTTVLSRDSMRGSQGGKKKIASPARKPAIRHRICRDVFGLWLAVGSSINSS